MECIVIFGTRPEITKLSPLFKPLHKEFNAKFIHTGQHYTYELDKIFFEDLSIRPPDYILGVASSSPGTQVGNMLLKLDRIIQKEKPDFILVQGDTNSTLAGGLIAVKSHVYLSHLEAGCRSFDRNMPEEINRIIVDHVSNKLLVPDRYSYDNLVSEGISKSRIHLVGNTSYEASKRNLAFAKRSKIVELLNIDKYVLVTLHRAENTDNQKILSEIISALNYLSSLVDIVFPIHPRTVESLKKYAIKLDPKIKVIKPIGYLDFLYLEKNAYFIMTDSGGIQEEAAMMDVPCLILRNTTEWMRYVDSGKNLLVGIKKESIINVSKNLLENKDILEKIRKIKVDFDFNVSK